MLDPNKYSKIWVLKEDKEYIDSLKIHKKQAAYEVVAQIIDEHKKGNRMQDVMQTLDQINTEDIIGHLQGMGYLVFLETEDEELITEVEGRGYKVLKN